MLWCVHFSRFVLVKGKMERVCIRFFIDSAGVLLTITAIAKLLSSFGHAGILYNIDPILSMTFQHVFWIVGAAELGIAFLCFSGKQLILSTGLVALLTTNFLIYRVGLVLIGYHRPCPCLGNLTDALHISPEFADMTMKIILVYLIIGSYVSLFWLWRQRKKAILAPA